MIQIILYFFPGTKVSFVHLQPEAALDEYLVKGDIRSPRTVTIVADSCPAMLAVQGMHRCAAPSHLKPTLSLQHPSDEHLGY